MSNNINTHGPAVRAEQLIDVYRATLHEPSPWNLISDQVMGGVSSAVLHTDERHHSPCTRLVGRTSLDNNGGFVQMKLNIDANELSADYILMPMS